MTLPQTMKAAVVHAYGAPLRIEEVKVPLPGPGQVLVKIEASGAVSYTHLVLREKKLLGHLVLRGDAADPAFAAAVHQALGLELPVALTLVASGETSLQWLAPDEWLLIVPGGEMCIRDSSN